MLPHRRPDCGDIPLILATALLSVVGCDSIEGPVACTSDLRPAVLVSVTDARTGEPLIEGVVGVAREGAYVDTLFQVQNRLYGAFERPGLYLLTVDKPGFVPWRRDDVRVAKDACHVITRNFEAPLSPDPE